MLLSLFIWFRLLITPSSSSFSQMFTLEHDQQQMLQITFLFVIRELAPMNPPNGRVCVC